MPVVAEHQEVRILCHELNNLGVLGSLYVENAL